MSGSVDYRNPEIISSLSRACPSTCCCMRALCRRGGSGDSKDPQQFQAPCSDLQTAGQASMLAHWGLRGFLRGKWGCGLTARSGGRGWASGHTPYMKLHGEFRLYWWHSILPGAEVPRAVMEIQGGAHTWLLLVAGSTEGFDTAGLRSPLVPVLKSAHCPSAS